MSENYCPVCHSETKIGLANWHRECPECCYESAELKPAINVSMAHEYIDEQLRENGLHSLRVENFNVILNALGKTGKTSGKLLDVGCAHGWFLETAQSRGFDVLGIEPDARVFKATTQRGLPLRQGFFPEILSDNEQFDVIAFNDVFEHIPDPEALLEGCRNHLLPGGVLVLNLPGSTGLLYRVSRLLARIGIKSFFERLWQKDLPSPHLHYFSHQNLNKLIINNGFEPVVSGRLSTVRLKGLFTRISYTGNYSLPVRVALYMAMVLALPLILIMPADIIYTIARKK